MLLEDVRQVFDARRVDRVSSQSLVEELVAMEGALWSEWRGKTGDRQPRPLTQLALADVLRDFDIVPATIWPMPRLPGSKSRKGYHRRQFEAARRAYCRQEYERPAHRLRVVRSA